MGFPGGAVVKNLPVNVGDARDRGSIHGLGRSPGGGNGNPPQYPCLENPMDRGAWSIALQRLDLACMHASAHRSPGWPKNKKWSRLCLCGRSI